MPVGSGQHVDVQARMIMAAVTWPLSIAWARIGIWPMKSGTTHALAASLDHLIGAEQD
jgi:hypothetical protein